MINAGTADFWEYQAHKLQVKEENKKKQSIVRVPMVIVNLYTHFCFAD